MPTLILPPRHSPDSITIRRAALSAGWDVERLSSWRVPADFSAGEPVLYGEPLFNAAISEQLGLVVVEPRPDFLATLNREYLGRTVQFLNASGARSLTGPVFLKPPNQKTFPAAV